MITVQRMVHFGCGERGRKQIQLGAPKAMKPVGRVPHVSRLMALAIRLDNLIREGVVADQAELARLGHVTRARLSQIMNLLHLAPDLQEQILFLPTFERGHKAITEKQLRPIAATLSWNKQRQLWRKAIRPSTFAG